MLTKRLIRDGFLNLLKTKNIYTISVRELCDEAGINRTTFYNHYGSPYDVLEEAIQYYLADVERKIENADPADKENVLERVTLVLQYARDNYELTKLLINNNIDETFAQRLFSLPKIEDMLNTALASVEDERTKRAAVDFVVSGSYKLLQNWMNDPDALGARAETMLILGFAGKVCEWKQ